MLTFFVVCLMWLTHPGGPGLELQALSWRRSSPPPSRPSLLFSSPSSSPAPTNPSLKLTDYRAPRSKCKSSLLNLGLNIIKWFKLWRRSIGGIAHLLILVGEESLEYFTAANNWMPAHPGHPALQPLHAHLNKLFFESPWKRQDREIRRQHRVSFSVSYIWCSQGRVLTCHLFVW